MLFIDKRQSFRYNVVEQRDRSGVDLADINPFRYRGYLYDYEFGLYYLQSRYYDPELCRFVNADEPVLVSASNSIIPNLYTYCDNDPINHIDVLGLFPVHLVVGAIAGFIWGILPRLVKLIFFNQKSKLSDFICDGLGGTISGLLTAATGNSSLGTFVGSLITEILRYFINNKPISNGKSFVVIFINVLSCLIMAFIAAIASMLAGGLIKKTTGKSFSSKQIHQYLKQTKKLSSALGIGGGGKTARRMWYMDSGFTTGISSMLNEMTDLVFSMLKQIYSL